MSDINAFPLSWPMTHPRTRWRTRSKFGEKSFAVARDNLMKELGRFGAEKIILSTNIPLRNDGLPYANYSRIQDPGVAVYFKKRLKGELKDFVFACDRWDRIEDNIYAIHKTIDALRGIDRWGSSDMQEKAFTGYIAIEAPKPKPKRHWTDVLGVLRTTHTDLVKTSRNRLLMENHPDRGGSQEKTAEINLAWDEFCRERGIS